MASFDETRPESTGDSRPTDETMPDVSKWLASASVPPTEFGKYEIIGEIARGGVGVVYKARQKGLERIVALKVLQGGTMATPGQIQRFMQEAQAAAKLQHPNIVPIHDFGVIDGQHYLTMDFIEGESLADVLAKGPMQSREALEIVRQVSDALQYAHEHGVVHRDIKPGNILIDKTGRVKVTDFGLAKEVTRDQMHLTVTGQVMGTPRYMSPEQAAGKTAQADGRSDIFSLGVTLYEMLTGKPAFDADNVVALLQKVLNEDPPIPQKVNPRVHRDVATVCMKAIEKDPRRRYQTSLAMTQDIERFLAGEPIEAKALGVFGHAYRKAKRYAKVIALNILLVSLAIYLLLFYYNSRPSHLTLQLRTEGADVALDGIVLSEAQLNTPLTIKAGKHRVQVAKEPECDPEDVTLETAPTESRTLTFTLERRKGAVAIATNPPDAAITIFGPNNFRIPLRGPRIDQELPTGHYAALVFRENYLARSFEFAIELRATNTFNITLTSITLWTVPTSGNVLSVPLVADVDGDGVADPVFGDDDGNIYCVSGRSGYPKWVHKVGDPVQAPISLVDVDHDGTPDVLVGSTDKNLYCLKGRDGHEVWRFVTKGAIIGPTLLKEVTGDGVPDAFFGSADGFVYAVSGTNGQLLWKFQTKGRIESALIWVRESANDVLVVGSSDRQAYALDPRTGQLLWQVDVGAPLLYPPRIEDIDQNGQLTVLFPTPKTPSDARTMTGISLTEHKVTGVSDSFPVWVDMDGAGKREKIVVTQAGTTCYASDGTTVKWQSSSLVVSPYFADVNGDGVLDLIFSADADQLVCLSGRDGAELGRIKLDASIGRGYALEDVDRDGVPDVVVGAGRRVYCFAWNGGRLQWQAKGESYYDATFVALDGRVVVKNKAGEIACYEPARNQPVWKVRTSPQPSPYPGVAAGQGMVVDADAETRLVRACAGADGKPVWSMRLPAQPKSPIIGAPAIGDTVVAVGNGVAGLYLFSLQDGKPRWQITAGEITVAPAIQGDSLVFCKNFFFFKTNIPFALRCVALADGKTRWTFPASDPFPSPPVFVDVNGDGVIDVVAVCDNGMAYALDGRTGEPFWSFQYSPVRARTHTGLALANGTGILVTAQGEVICLDLKHGLPKWTYRLNEPVLSEPAIADMNGDGVPDIIVGTMNRRVRCISGRGDIELWSYEVGAQIRYSAPVLVKIPGAVAPRVFVGTGPPDDSLYCLSGDCPRPYSRGWFGPWKTLTVGR